MAPTYSDEQRDEIIAHALAEVAGGRSLHKVLNEDEGMPGASTFWRWHMADEDLRDNLARARENGVEAILEEARAISDTPQMGEIVTEKPIMVEGKPLDGVTAREVKTEDMLGHRKLQIETRIKYAQMIAPRKYGPRTLLGSDPENPLPPGFNVNLIKAPGEAG